MIRVPLTSLHAPWVLLFGAGVAVVVIVAAAGAMAAGRLAERPPARLLRAGAAADVLARAAHRLAQNALALLRVWREAHRTPWGWRRRLAKLSAHDGEDFTGKGIPRRDWRVFGEQLADLLWEVHVRERGGPQ